VSIYEIVNPSDHYTLLADDDRVATAAILLLGGGKYGGTKEGDDSYRCPLLMFIKNETALEEALNAPFAPDTFDAWLEGHKGEVIAALKTVLIGNRQEAAEALALIPAEKHAEFLAKRHDRLRSSMNDIGARAAALARSMTRKQEAKP